MHAEKNIQFYVTLFFEEGKEKNVTWIEITLLLHLNNCKRLK
jgi:hypothetical protein